MQDLTDEELLAAIEESKRKIEAANSDIEAALEELKRRAKANGG